MELPASVCNDMPEKRALQDQERLGDNVCWSLAGRVGGILKLKLNQRNERYF